MPGIGSIIVGLALCAAVFLAARSVWRDLRAGRCPGGCGGSCEGCDHHK